MLDGPVMYRPITEKLTPHSPPTPPQNAKVVSSACQGKPGQPVGLEETFRERP